MGAFDPNVRLLKGFKYASSIQLFFLLKVVRPSHTDVTSFRMQFEKIERVTAGSFSD